MLGLLLARAGVDVTVLEKHDDFFRDFRGDTIHASTLQVIEELGLAQQFLQLPHQVATQLEAVVGGERIVVADFTVLGGPHSHVLIMPQWDFLDFVTSEAGRHAGFRLLMGAEATDIIREGERVAGVLFRHNGETRVIRSKLTVACDGRHSTLRERAGLEPREFGAPMDVLWFRLPRKPDDPAGTGARIEAGVMLVLINRGEYWQAAYVISKGGFERVRGEGLDALRSSVGKLASFLDEPRLDAIATWDDVKMLRVQVNRLRRWSQPGLLFLGDAAHAMSPIGGVGINLAIQDAVAAANILAEPLRTGAATETHLARVQSRRWFPTVATQALQRVAQRRVIGSILAGDKAIRPPAWLPKVLGLKPVRRAVARTIAIGIRPEHVAPDIR
jgi:2-polyprenyl-6-methoxyphenol hydroxylase-like FAD-dependent oxidoreductase